MSNTIVKNKSISDFMNIRVPDSSKKCPKVSEANFFIPKMNEHNLLVTNNYKVAQRFLALRFYSSDNTCILLIGG